MRPFRSPSIWGLVVALRLMFTGKVLIINANCAMAFGMINDICDGEALDDAGRDLPARSKIGRAHV